MTYNHCIEAGRGRSRDRPCCVGDRFLDVNGVRVENIQQFADAVKMESVMRATLQRPDKVHTRGAPLSQLNVNGDDAASRRLRPAMRQDSRSLEVQAGQPACGLQAGGLSVEGIASYVKERLPTLMLADARQLLADLTGPATEERLEESDDDDEPEVEILDLVSACPGQHKAYIGSETDPSAEEGDVETFVVDIDLLGGALGATIDPSTWAITDIKEGSVMSYNRRCTDNPLLLGDRILEVNGQTIEHPDDMRDAIQRGTSVRVTIQRTQGRFFDEKKISVAGEESLHEGNPRLGFSCCKGRKPIPNQDSWCAVELEGKFALYGVFDGHGADCHDISQYVKDKLPRAILRDPRFLSGDMTEMLKEKFINLQSQVRVADRRGKLKAQDSGSTATVVIHDMVGKRLIMAHVGDSTAAIGKRSRGTFGLDIFGGWDVSPITEDHKPNMPKEEARIKKAGGRIVFDGRNHRVYASPSALCGGLRPGLNLSRSFGDLEGDSAGVISAEPDVHERTLAGDEDLLILGSDGVWEYLPPREAGSVLGQQGSSAEDFAQDLAAEARDRWCKAPKNVGYVDDITAVVLCLKPPCQTARSDLLGAFSAR